MSKTKLPVLFFRGLNTYGDDHIHIGPWLKLGEMSSYLSKALAPTQFISVGDMGAGGPQEMAERGWQWLRKRPEIFDQEGFHVLGHSTGGLAAQVLMSEREFRKCAKSLVTIGTPHRGTPLATAALELSPLTLRLMKLLNYDIDRRREYFRKLTPEIISQLKNQYPLPEEVPFASIVASLPRDELSMGLRGLAQLGKLPLSDGFVPLESQKWGKVIHEGALDHLEEIGFSMSLRAASRQRFQKEFSALIAALHRFWHLLDFPANPA